MITPENIDKICQELLTAIAPVIIKNNISRHEGTALLRVMADQVDSECEGCKENA